MATFLLPSLRMSTTNERSLADVAKDLTSDLTALVRGELALAKAEISENVARLGTGAGLLGGAGVVGLFAIHFLLLALMFGLYAMNLPLWAAALIVGVVLGIVAGVLAMRGKQNVAGASVVPTHALEQMKRDAETIKSDLERARSRS